MGLNQNLSQIVAAGQAGDVRDLLAEQRMTNRLLYALLSDDQRQRFDAELQAEAAAAAAQQPKRRWGRG